MDKDQTEVDLRYETHLQENLEDKQILDEIARYLSKGQQIFEVDQKLVEKPAMNKKQPQTIEEDNECSDSDTQLDLNTFQDDMKRNRKLLEIKNKARPRKVKKEGVGQPISEESSQQSLN